MNVLDFLRAMFPDYTMHDDTLADALRTMPLDSACGADCKAVIDAAMMFASHLRMAWGEGLPDHMSPDDVVRTAAEVCGTYICG